MSQSSSLKEQADRFLSNVELIPTEQHVGVTRTHLVKENSGKADAKFGGDDCEATFGPTVLPG